MNWLLFVEMLCYTDNNVFQVYYQEKPPTDDQRKAITNEARMLIAKHDEIKDDHHFGRYRRQLAVDKLCHHLRRLLVHMTFNWGDRADLIEKNFDVLDSWTHKLIGLPCYSFDDDIKWTINYYYSCYKSELVRYSLPITCIEFVVDSIMNHLGERIVKIQDSLDVKIAAISMCKFNYGVKSSI